MNIEEARSILMDGHQRPYITAAIGVYDARIKELKIGFEGYRVELSSMTRKRDEALAQLDDMKEQGDVCREIAKRHLASGLSLCDKVEKLESNVLSLQETGMTLVQALLDNCDAELVLSKKES